MNDEKKSHKWIIDVKGLFPKNNIDSSGNNYVELETQTKTITMHGTMNEMELFCESIKNAKNNIVSIYKETETLVEFRIATDHVGDTIYEKIVVMDIFNHNASWIISKSEAITLTNEKNKIEWLKKDYPTRMFIDKEKLYSTKQKTK